MKKISLRIIYNITKKYDECGQVEDKPRSGRPKKLCRRQRNQLKCLVNHKTGVSLSQLASKFRVNHQTIHTYLEEMNIKYYKKQRSPKYIDQQLQEVPVRAHHLYQMLPNNDFQLVMDDEKCFLLTDQSISTNLGFYTSDNAVTSSEVKYKRTNKHEEKLLVWIAISTNEISSSFFAKKLQVINETTYLNECILKRLMPFVDRHHIKEKVLF